MALAQRTTELEASIDELTLVYMDDFHPFAEDQLKIKAKDGSIVPLVLNDAQEYFHEIVEIQHAAFGMVRALALKGRQQGISTYVEGRYFWKVEFNEGLRAFILTHEQSATDTIFEMAERYHVHVDEPWQHATTAANAKELRFASDAGYQVATAGTKAAGRSKTVHLFHGSEVAFWPAAESHAAGVIQAVPLEPETEIVLESTANGTGGYFHAQWLVAWTLLQEKYNGDLRRMARDYPGYLPIFIPWFWQKEYVVEAPEDFEPTEEEARLIVRFRLTPEQIMWRRGKIAELGLDLFKQEYPCHPDEAFLHSGRLFFPGEALDYVAETVLDPIARGVLEWARDGVVFKAQSNGWLWVWELPDEEADYTLGADVAEGLEDPADRSVCDVLRRGVVTYQVAQIIPDVDPDTYGEQVIMAAEWYTGRAWAGIERNSFGRSAVNAARKTGYQHIYKMHRGEAQVREDAKTDKYGWETNVASRPVLCNSLLAGLRDQSIVVRSRTTLQELGSFVVKNGKPQASDGCRDDAVIALGIAWQMCLKTKPVPRNDAPAGSRRPRLKGRQAWMQ